MIEPSETRCVLIVVSVVCVSVFNAKLSRVIVSMHIESVCCINSTLLSACFLTKKEDYLEMPDKT